MMPTIPETDRRRAEFKRIENDARSKVVEILYPLFDPKNELYYHNPEHTLQQVYPAAKMLAAETFHEDEKTRDEGMLLMAVAALYHDTGFATQYQENEPIGAMLGKQFALSSGNEFLQDNADLIADAILNTNMKSAPTTDYARILRDADLSIMGQVTFIEWSQRLRKEAIAHPESGLHAAAMDDKKWFDSQLQFLLSQTWFTEAAKRKYDEQKQKNIVLFEKRFRK